MITPHNQWVSVYRLKNHNEIYQSILRVAGEGEEITPAQVGKTERDFQEPVIMLIVLRGSEILYSMDRSTGAVCAEYVGLFKK